MKDIRDLVIILAGIFFIIMLGYLRAHVSDLTRHVRTIAYVLREDAQRDVCYTRCVVEDGVGHCDTQLMGME